MQKEEPFISICIPTYNRSKYLMEAIESALLQSYKNYEIVIVNDGSNDDTESIILNIKNNKIKYFFKVHTNAPDSRNRALKEAKGDYLLWLDDDDILHQDILEIYVDYINRYPDVEIFYCKLLTFNENKGQMGQYTYYDWYNKKDEIAAYLINGQPIPNPGTLVSKKVYDEISGFNIEFNRAQDYEFYSRVFMTKKFNVKYVDEFLLKYRLHQKNITSNLRGEINLNYEIRILRKLLESQKISFFFPSYNWDLDYFKSLAEAQYTIGKKFFNYGAYIDSIFYFTASLRINNDCTKLNNIIQAFIGAGAIKELKILIFLVNEFFLEFPQLKEVIKIIDDYKD